MFKDYKNLRKTIFSDLLINKENTYNFRRDKVLQAATRGVLCKKVFLEISKNSQENTCARASSLIK